MTESWDDIADWWIDAVRGDPSQSDDTHDALVELLRGTSGPALDLGCGEGHAMRLVGGVVIGCDLSIELLGHARASGPVVQARLPGLSWVRSNAVNRVFSVGLLDLIDDHVAFFGATANVVRQGGHLVVVINHPVATAPHSEALNDPLGEVFWRWGNYLAVGSRNQRVENHTVELFHRPLGTLLAAAASAGWCLETMIERGPSLATLARFPELRGQEGIPCLAGFRWSRT